MRLVADLGSVSKRKLRSAEPITTPPATTIPVLVSHSGYKGSWQELPWIPFGCIAARLLHGDLEEIDRRLASNGELNIHWIVLVKHTLICVANLIELERLVRQIYQKHPDVSKEFKKWDEKFDFAKYMRNIFVGHTDIRLIAKAIEWKPELLSLLRDNRTEATFLVNLFLLETAINTYVDGNEQHLVFDSDTDLMYPENWDRFLIFLTEIVRGGA